MTLTSRKTIKTSRKNYSKMRAFMNMEDKKTISKSKLCPAHYMPHKIPLGEKIKDERCHLHKKKLNMLHHTFFCKYLNCPNYKFMISKYKK